MIVGEQRRQHGIPFPPPSHEQVLARLSGETEQLKSPNKPPTPKKRFAASTPKPPEPHDWRWVVGGIGRVLITMGLLIFAFVGYQLWGTGIQYRQHQNELGQEFAELLALRETTPIPVVVAISPDGQDGPAGELAPVDGSVDQAGDGAADPAAPVAPVARPLPPVVLGEPVALLKIPKLDLDTYLVAGVRTEDLKTGVGHFPDTPLPGQSGNAAVAGHRTTHGAPFGDLDRLAPGDRVIVDTLQGHFEYVITGSSVVEPSDYGVVTNVPDQNLLTLITCHPKYTAKLRLIVTAVLDEVVSSPLAEPQLYYGRDPGDLESGSDGLSAEAGADGSADAGVLPEGSAIDPAVAESGVDPNASPAGDPAVDPADPAAVDSGQAPGSQSDQPGLGESDDSIDGGATATATNGDASGESDAAGSVDAFSAGWFSDSAAWPQVALWGFACSLVALAAWLLGRRTNNWIAIFVGIAPFAVVLYFFFENVNRLLPPNL